MIRRILIFCLFIGVASASISEEPEQAIDAWWLKATFPTNLTVYEGLEVGALDPDWEKIGVNSYDALPREARDDLQWMHHERFSFAMEGNLSGKGFVDRAVTGVFDARGGSGALRPTAGGPAAGRRGALQAPARRGVGGLTLIRPRR